MRSRPLSAVADTIVLTLDNVAKRAQQRSDAPTTDNNSLSALDSLYRVDHIKVALTKIQTSIEVAQREGSAVPRIGHFVLRGSPGTGKTTVARVIATIFHRMGLLAIDTLVETSGLSLTGEYVGQTKTRVADMLDKARGGVLFIDEAYELGRGSFGEEAMTALVATMTSPQYAGVVIILAGYARDIDTMLDRNAGLKSRFTRVIDFTDWTPLDCVQCLQATSERDGFALPLEAIAAVRDTFDALTTLPSFGNNHDVMQLWAELLACRAQRVQAQPELLKTITIEDAVAASRNSLAARAPVMSAAMQQQCAIATGSPAALDDSSARDSAPRVTTRSATATDEEANAANKAKSSDDDGKAAGSDQWSCIERDPNVADDTWAELERAKRAKDALMREQQVAADKATREAAARKIAELAAKQQ